MQGRRKFSLVVFHHHHWKDKKKKKLSFCFFLRMNMSICNVQIYQKRAKMRYHTNMITIQYSKIAKLKVIELQGKKTELNNLLLSILRRHDDSGHIKYF